MKNKLFAAGIALIGAGGVFGILMKKKKDAKRGLVLKESKMCNPGISQLPLGIFLTVTGYDKNGIVTAKLSNQSGYEMKYTDAYGLSMKVGEEWFELVPEVILPEAKEEHVIADLCEVSLTYDLSVFGTLAPGEYCLTKPDLSAEFTLVRK